MVLKFCIGDAVVVVVAMYLYMADRLSGKFGFVGLLSGTKVSPALLASECLSCCCYSATSQLSEHMGVKIKQTKPK